MQRQPVRRVRRIQRHVGAAGLEHAQQRHHQRRGALQADADRARPAPRPARAGGSPAGWRGRLAPRTSACRPRRPGRPRPASAPPARRRPRAPASVRRGAGELRRAPFLRHPAPLVRRQQGASASGRSGSAATAAAGRRSGPASGPPWPRRTAPRGTPASRRSRPPSPTAPGPGRTSPTPPSRPATRLQPAQAQRLRGRCSAARTSPGRAACGSGCAPPCSSSTSFSKGTSWCS